jgi:hypothetical protein
MDDLRAGLERWVAAGTISREQADAILAAEAEEGRQAGGRRTVAVEALGYVGGALALVAGVTIGAGQFARLGQGGKIALLFVVTAGLFAGGWWLRDARTSTLRRLGSLLWFLSVGSWAGLLQVWFDGVAWFRLHDGLATAAGTTVYAGALYLLERRSLQQIALFIPAAGTVVQLAREIVDAMRGGAPLTRDVIGAPRPEELLGGALLVVLGAAWLELGRRGAVRPRRTSEALGALGLVAGIEVLWGGRQGWALGLGVATALGLVVAGSALRRTVLLGMGGAALLLFLAEIAGAYWTSLGAPLAILLVGLGLVTVAVVIARLQPRGPAARTGG